MSRRFAVAYFTTLVSFVALDAVWLSTMASRLYQPAVGHLMRPDFAWPPAVAFYLLYVVGLVFFGVMAGIARGAPGVAAGRCALFGLIAYATYDLTNQATLRDWSWVVTFADLAWGTFASALAGAVACRATAYFTARRAG